MVYVNIVFTDAKLLDRLQQLLIQDKTKSRLANSINIIIQSAPYRPVWSHHRFQLCIVAIIQYFTHHHARRYSAIYNLLYMLESQPLPPQLPTHTRHPTRRNSSKARGSHRHEIAVLNSCSWRQWYWKPRRAWGRTNLARLARCVCFPYYYRSNHKIDPVRNSRCERIQLWTYEKCTSCFVCAQSEEKARLNCVSDGTNHHIMQFAHSHQWSNIGKKERTEKKTPTCRW